MPIPAKRATNGRRKLSATVVVYMELEGAKKDGGCEIVDVKNGISKEKGCCDVWDGKKGAEYFRCGTCTFVT